MPRFARVVPRRRRGLATVRVDGLADQAPCSPIGGNFSSPARSPRSRCTCPSRRRTPGRCCRPRRPRDGCRGRGAPCAPPRSPPRPRGPRRAACSARPSRRVLASLLVIAHRRPGTRPSPAVGVTASRYATRRCGCARDRRVGATAWEARRRCSTADSAPSRDAAGPPLVSLRLARGGPTCVSSGTTRSRSRPGRPRGRRRTRSRRRRSR